MSLALTGGKTFSSPRRNPDLRRAQRGSMGEATNGSETDDRRRYPSSLYSGGNCILPAFDKDYITLYCIRNIICDMVNTIKEVISVAKTANMYIRIDPQVKSDVEAIFSRYGMSITDAINVFLYTSRNVGGLPFDLRPSAPNAETMEAIREGSKIIESGKTRFTNADDMLRELKA